MYFDNTKLEFVTLGEKEPETPYVPDMSDLASRETYEDGDELNLFSYNQWLNKADGSVVAVDGKPYGVDSKVLYFGVVENPGYFEVGFEQKSIPEGTKVYVFESDMMFDPTGTAKMTGDFRGSSSGAGFTFDVVEGGMVTFNGVEIAKAGEWFRFTAECYEDESGASMVKFYINENQIGSAVSNSIAASTIQRTRFMMKNYLCDVYFDNTKVEFRAE